MPLDERDLKHIREILDIKVENERHNTDFRFTAEAQARILAANELARRLDILNHAHEQAVEMQRDFVPRETYENRHLAIVNDITELKEFRATILGRQVIITAIVSAIVALVTAIIARYI